MQQPYTARAPVSRNSPTRAINTTQRFSYQPVSSHIVSQARAAQAGSAGLPLRRKQVCGSCESPIGFAGPLTRHSSIAAPQRPPPAYSSSLSSSELSSAAAAAAAFLAGFFFFLLFFFLPVFLAMGCSRILRISSSSIFLSVLYLLRSSAGAAPSLVMPFLVMAIHRQYMNLSSFLS